MRISIICRLNQARSVFAHCLVANQFPELEVESAGIDTELGLEPLPLIMEIAQEWGLSAFIHTPKHIDQLKSFIEASDLILISEPYMAKSLLDYNFVGKLAALEDFVLDSNFLPKDPIGLREEKMKIELAKIFYATTRAIECELGFTSKFEVKSVIPLSHSDNELAFTFARFERQQTQGFLIDCDLRSPYSNDFASEDDFHYYDPGNFGPEENLLKFKSKIWTPYREFRNPEALLISRSWREQIVKISQIAPVTLLTAPRNVNGHELPDSFLASSVCTNITTISC